MCKEKGLLKEAGPLRSAWDRSRGLFGSLLVPLLVLKREGKRDLSVWVKETEQLLIIRAPVVWVAQHILYLAADHFFCVCTLPDCVARLSLEALRRSMA